MFAQHKFFTNNGYSALTVPIRYFLEVANQSRLVFDSANMVDNIYSISKYFLRNMHLKKIYK